MPDPIYYESNRIIPALFGDAAINREMASYRKQGRELLVVPAVWDEVRKHNNPKIREYGEIGMSKLGLKYDAYARTGPQSVLDRYRSIGSHNVSLEDRFVLADVKASAEARGIANPELITDDKTVQTHANRWGVKATVGVKMGSSNKPPRVTIADYPEDRKGRIVRYFGDRPILNRVGILGVNSAANLAQADSRKAVENHFNAAITDARKDFLAQCPDPAELKKKADIADFQKAYKAALSKLEAPTNLNKWKGILLAFTKDKDIGNVKKQLDNQISEVETAAKGTLGGFTTVAYDYIDALVELHKELSAVQSDLPDIAADIRMRGSLLSAAASEMLDLYFDHVAVISAFPVAYYAWMEVYDWGLVLQRLGANVLGFEMEISARYESYVSMQKQLEAELVKVSEELAKRAPEIERVGAR